MKSRRMVLACVLGLISTLLVLAVLSTSLPSQAAAAVRYVATTGSDTGDCTTIVGRCRTIQYALDVAAPLDEIRVAQGTYTDTVGTVATITQTVKLLGGWDNGFTTRDPDTFPTTLDAQQNGRVIYINGNVTPTLDGFTITGGNANSEAEEVGHGGGIYSGNASPIIQHNIITGNVASISPTFGYGGGIYLTNAQASTLISGNQVLSNTGSISGSSNGGGIYLWQSDGTILSNLITINTSGRDGGGVYSVDGSPHLLDNEVRGNVAGRNGGGLLLIGGFPLVQGNLIADNLAGWDGTNWHGGGLMVMYRGSPTITANRVFSNAAGTGAGVVLETNGNYTVTNNFIAHNSTCGIKVWDLTQYSLIAYNTIVFNTGSEGGIKLAYGYITPTIVNNIIVSNTYGIRAHSEASGTLDYNDVWGNTTQDYDLPGALEPGPHDIQADPLLVHPTIDDYHILSGSPVIDLGLNIGVTSDIDGDARPQGGGYDLGADEYREWRLYLPSVLRQ